MIVYFPWGLNSVYASARGVNVLGNEFIVITKSRQNMRPNPYAYSLGCGLFPVAFASIRSTPFHREE